MPWEPSNEDCQHCQNPCVTKTTSGGKREKFEIREKNVVACAFDDRLPSDSDELSEILGHLKGMIIKASHRLKVAVPSDNAFNNVRGAWFEILFYVTCWNVRRLEPSWSDRLLIKLPSKSQFSLFDLFEGDTRGALLKLIGFLQKHNTELISSNPDVVCVANLQNFSESARFETEIHRLGPETLPARGGPGGQLIEDLVSKYQHIVRCCRYNSILFGIGLKTSIRPDRRIQLVHEGSTLKALMAHLNVRFWDPSHATRYYVATVEGSGPADDEAFRSAATHSIMDVYAPPVKSIDGAFRINTLSKVKEMLYVVMEVTQ